MLETLKVAIAILFALAFLTAVLVLSWKSIPIYQIGTPDTVGDLINPDHYSKYFWLGVAVVSAVGWVVWRYKKRGKNYE